MTTASRITTRSGPVAISAAVQHVALAVGSDDDSVSELRSRIAWVAEGPRRRVDIDLTRLGDRHAVTVLALVSATAARARALGNEVRVINLPAERRRDARGFGIRSA